MITEQFRELDLQKGTVLAIDDQKSDLLVIESALSDMYQVITTTSPEDALVLAKQLLPDVILLDIDMPKISGFELCRAMQNIPELSFSSFIFITSHNKASIETEALELGAADFIGKPIHLDICRLRVQSQMLIKQQSRSLHKAYILLHSEKNHLNTILRSIGDAVIATDNNECVTFINTVAQRLTGYSEKESLGRPIAEIMNLRDASNHESMRNPLSIALEQQRAVAMALNAELIGQDGTRYRVEDTASPIFDMEGKHIIGGVIVFQDVTASVAMSTQMTHLTHHDHLTGLPNRVLLHDRMLQAISLSQDSEIMVAALLIDIDNFKYVNDAKGHHLGDTIIKHVASRLKSVGDAYTTVSRIGGDEFVILLSRCKSYSYVNQIASSVISTINTPFQLDDQEHRLTVSVGVSVFPDDAKTPEQLMRHADTAMYKVKNDGKNGVSFYANELSENLEERVSIEQLLHQRLEENAMIVHFQPKFSLKGNRITGMEALVRMEGHNGELMSPFTFVPIAEECGLIKSLGKAVLEESCRQAKKWLASGTPVKVAVNIGASQFNEFGFAQTVKETLAEYGLPAQWLELEITESALIQNINSAKKAIYSLQQLGVSVALDDFGTGYSSLSYLKSFNFDVLKIDRSFIIDIETDKQALSIVKAIFDLSNSLHLEVVCEGIETQSQMQALKEMGCEYGQGYYFAYPKPAEAHNELLLKLIE
ncbi:putative bifunctional diguanylate cyclase/phosphodiesterase [Alteromonas genovensis]|uniref:putative bifunctional diguanylate cyclase/phosphodiesterase n=1 Tax=Alteromonas genovensis TaxID=471225 RepID=UPI002FDF66B7